MLGCNEVQPHLAGLQHFSIITDHNPLIPIINNRHLDEIENPRLKRLKTMPKKAQNQTNSIQLHC